MALFISWGGKYAIATLVLLAIGFVYKTHSVHRKREEDIKKSEEDFKIDFELNGKNVQERCNIRVVSSLIAISELYNNIINAFIGEKRKKLKNAMKDIRKLDREVKSFKKNVHDTVRTLQIEESVETGDYYVQLLDYLRETAHCMNFIVQPVFDHVDNNHAPLSQAQISDLKAFLKNFSLYLDKVVKTISSNDYKNIDKLNLYMQEILAELSKMRKNHLKRIKSDNIGTRISMLYLDILNETKNLVLFTINLAKASRDFVEQSQILTMNPGNPKISN
jgi:Na+/phosphate symporter